MMAAKKGMYTPEVMERNLSHGDVAEAMLRLWVETKLGTLKNTEVIHTGYNPGGVVGIAEKASLSEESDPDFALALKRKAGEAVKMLLGISVNAQQRLYNIQSTSGGFCSVRLQPKSDEPTDEPCPTCFECFTGPGSRVWYNRPNVENDYPRFQEKTNARDTVLVTFLSTRPARFVDWMNKRLSKGERQALELTIRDYLRRGTAGATDSVLTAEFVRRLVFGHQKTKPVLKFGLRWFLLSDIQNERVPFWITGGLSQNGRPPKKYCLPHSHSRDEASLIEYLREIDLQVDKQGLRG